MLLVIVCCLFVVVDVCCCALLRVVVCCCRVVCYGLLLFVFARCCVLLRVVVCNCASLSCCYVYMLFFIVISLVLFVDTCDDALLHIVVYCRLLLFGIARVAVVVACCG